MRPRIEVPLLVGTAYKFDPIPKPSILPHYKGKTAMQWSLLCPACHKIMRLQWVDEETPKSICCFECGAKLRVGPQVTALEALAGLD